MTVEPLRVMVMEDDLIHAQRLTAQIRECGHLVVGPFADVHEAFQIAGSVQAAILDVAAQTESCFWVADTLRHSDVPFVFLTDAGPGAIPHRFDGHRAYPRHRHAAPLLNDLLGQRRLQILDDDDAIQTVVIQMMQHSRRVMPDDPSAERLVEATLQRAVTERSAGGDGSADVGPWLLQLLDQEYRMRGRSHLH
jgi:hypothetical protein